MPSMATVITALAALVLTLFCSPASPTRLFDRRSDPAEVPSVSTSGWTLPVGHGHACTDANICAATLPPPADNKTLALIAIGRGIFNYSCESAAPANGPSFVAQYTELYDAAPLVPGLQNEDAFHALIQQVYDFDYGELKNSSLECSGSIGTPDGTAVVTLYNLDTFEAYLEETEASPDDPGFNGLWAHSRSPDDQWEMYRVEMVGGAVPSTCQGHTATFEIQYAAEYWFYRV